MALRAARGQAPAAQDGASQAPARPGAGGAAIRHTPSTQSARAAAPIVAARPLRRTATAPAAPGSHPIKKSPPGACDEARPYCSTIRTNSRPWRSVSPPRVAPAGQGGSSQADRAPQRRQVEAAQATPSRWNGCSVCRQDRPNASSEAAGLIARCRRRRCRRRRRAPPARPGRRSRHSSPPPCRARARPPRRPAAARPIG